MEQRPLGIIPSVGFFLYRNLLITSNNLFSSQVANQLKFPIRFLLSALRSQNSDSFEIKVFFFVYISINTQSNQLIIFKNRNKKYETLLLTMVLFGNR